MNEIVALILSTAFYLMAARKWIFYEDPDPNRSGLSSTIYLLRNDSKARDLFIETHIYWLAWVYALFVASRF